ncbi:MAG TPA: hypothetical protein VL651_14750 [Bacteroidia bacterium]|jgi:hypothetical protein|nr:hypothetical protein [Bacteroidia bacterium]
MKLTRFHIALLFFFFSLLDSCRFAAPLLRFRIDRFVNVDSANNNRSISTYFSYINFTRRISIGGGEKTRTYNADGKLIYKMVSKATLGALRDGRNRHYVKEVWYDDHGKMIRRHRKIRQNHGRSASTVFEDSLIRPATQPK